MARRRVTGHRERSLPSGQRSSRSSVSKNWEFLSNIPTKYNWVSEEVLGTSSRVNSEYLEKLKSSQLIFHPNEADKYKLSVPNSKERIEPLPGVPPFFLDYGNKRFPLYWNYYASSPTINFDDLSLEESVVVESLLDLSNKKPLDPKDLFSNEVVARSSIVDMVGGLAAIPEMRRKMLNDANNSGSREQTSFSTEKDDVVDQNIEVLNPEQTSLASPPRKKQKKGKETAAKDVISLEANASYSFGCVLKQGFKAAKFIDSCLLTTNTEETL
ncbi:hypothetical protein PIB30_040096 [Stylosanthes scabra]|uniref:Uncharacterized protein n=1 Tax=Stylosanthes scabra TaxID=79078 RepID=A0ABU6ZD73_9FABA|nr:hypothetical protein [Stylosanthes scabra]